MVGRCHFVTNTDIDNTLEAHTLGVLPSVSSRPKRVGPCPPTPPKRRRTVPTRTPPATPKQSPAARVRDDALGTYVEVMAREFELTGWKGVQQHSHNRGDL
jgi:hypothetical protein